MLIASIRIVATYTVFSHTSDEPAHLACGMEWLDSGMYTWQTALSPLARVAVAWGRIFRPPPQGTPQGEILQMFKEGVKILYSGRHYDRTLALARLGILPFFWVACLAVYWWGRRYFGRAVAVSRFSSLRSFLRFWRTPVSRQRIWL